MLHQKQFHYYIIAIQRKDRPLRKTIVELSATIFIVLILSKYRQTKNPLTSQNFLKKDLFLLLFTDFLLRTCLLKPHFRA